MAISAFIHKSTNLLSRIVLYCISAICKRIAHVVSKKLRSGGGNFIRRFKKQAPSRSERSMVQIKQKVKATPTVNRSHRCGGVPDWCSKAGCRRCDRCTFFPTSQDINFSLEKKVALFFALSPLSLHSFVPLR